MNRVKAKSFEIFLLLGLFSMLNINIFAQAEIVKLWDKEIPGSLVDTSYKEELLESKDGFKRIAKVSQPDISVYLPQDKNELRTAVVICPGGGYSILANSHEGKDIAAWLNKLGIVGVLLKYRLPGDAIMKDKSIGPLQDVQQAFRIVRRNAKKWGIDANKIGVIGFSAGGHLASTISTHYNEKVYDSDTTSCRPDFSILIYPVISMNSEITHMGSRENLLGKNPGQQLVEHFSNDLQINEKTPPAFLVHSEDDKAVPVQNSINYFLSLKKFNVPAELHIYDKGGHGYGLGRNEGTKADWPKACEHWMKSMGFIK